MSINTYNIQFICVFAGRPCLVMVGILYLLQYFIQLNIKQKRIQNNLISKTLKTVTISIPIFP